MLAEQLAWDTDASIEALRRVEEAARERLEDRAVLEAIEFHRRLLEGDVARPFSEIGELPCQLLHGDLHDEQVLLAEDDSVVGVVDWELTRVAARVWELIRSRSFSGVLETHLPDHYLRGFRGHVQLTEQECRGGIELWWQTRLHGTWVYEVYFLEGNDRVRPLLGETDRHLRRFADETWRTQIADRLVAASSARRD